MLDPKISLSRLASSLLLSCCVISPAAAQISSDGTRSTSVTTPNNLDFTINNGSRAGSNLFHSFSQFSIPTGGSAIFNNAPDIANIFSRVTGGSVSNIDGLIQANGTANLFLLNPNGIIFSANSSLQIGGSFLATTADSIVFQDGSLFSATQPNASPLLTVSVPIGLQMGSNPGNIIVRGTNKNIGSGFTNLNSANNAPRLQVQPGQTLALLGGNLFIEGKDLIASSGRIELGSITANNFVQLSSLAEGWTLDYQGVEGFHDITLTQAALIDTSGRNGGNIQIQGRRVRVDEGTTVSGRTRGRGNGGTLLVRASELLEVIGGENATRLSVSLAPGSSGQGGNIVIETGQLRLVDGGQLGAGTLGSGNTGNITVRADAINIIGTASSDNFPSGLFVTVQAIGTGNGGDLIIDTESLKIADGGTLAAFTVGDGNAGNIIIQADEIDVSGTSVFGVSSIDAFSTKEFAAGSININTGRLSVRNGAEITVSSSSLGDAGNLNINARNIFLANGSRLRAEVNGGSQGNINLKVSDTLVLRRDSSINANATGASTGGNININAGVIVGVPGENSDISANAEASFGGRVTLRSNGIFGLKFRPQLTPNSDITASSGLGAAFSGTVEIGELTSDPSSGLSQLSTELSDPSKQIASGCDATEGSTFVVTGRGGLPPNPTELLRSTRPWADVRDLSEFRSSETVAAEPEPANPPKIVEATGWIVNEAGNVELVATVPNGGASINATNCAGAVKSEGSIGR